MALHSNSNALCWKDKNENGHNNRKTTQRTVLCKKNNKLNAVLSVARVPIHS